MMTLEEVWESLRQDAETKATMEEAEKGYKLFKKIENLIVADLESKLAESERFLEKQCYKSIQELEDVFNYNLNQVAILSQQLAEKEKEIENLKSKEKKIRLHTKRDWFERCCRLEDKSISLGLENIDLKQSQNQTAIEKLEKVKDFIVKSDIPTERKTLTVRFINQQITELKGEK